MDSCRVITKYPNRRLYDTVESRYITLSDIRELVVRKIDFEVHDRRSGEDITRSILLQVIAEQEQQGQAVMSRDFLSQVIRAYDKVLPGFASDYLDQSMRFFMAQQQNLRSQIRRVVGFDPLATVAEAAQKNFARWRTLQEEVLRRFATVSQRREDSANDRLTADHEKA